MKAMSLKSEKLKKRTQEILQLVTECMGQSKRLPVIAQDLKAIIDTLESRKLVLQIVSQNASVAQALQSILGAYQPLFDLYHVQTIALSDKAWTTKPIFTATLTLQPLAGQVQSYEFSGSETHRIGRQFGCHISLPDHYLLVSGHHAEVQYVPAANPEQMGTWQLRDTSRHGTYVNGQRVQGSQALQPGDRICLGYAEPTEESPEFVFTDSSDRDAELLSQRERFYQQVVNCDVLCFATDVERLLTEQNQYILEQASRIPVRKFVVVVDSSGDSAAYDRILNHCNQQITGWVNDRALGLSTETLLIPTDILKTNDTPITLAPEIHSQLQKFFNALQVFVKREAEDILLKRLGTQLMSQINRIEQHLTTQFQQLEYTIQQEALKLQEIEKKYTQRQTDKAFKQISDDKAECFRQLRAKLDQSKDDLLYEPLTYSIMYKIRQTIDDLKPCMPDKTVKYLELGIEVSEPEKPKRRAKKRKQPQKQVIDANTVLMDVCQRELTQWTTNEWQQICLSYAGDGLVGLYRRTLTTIAAISSTTPDPISLQPRTAIEVADIFQDSFDRPSCKTPYSDISLPAYLLKKVRGSLLQLMSALILLSFVGISRRQTVQWVIAYISASPILVIIALAAVVYLLKTLLTAYQKDREAARNQEVEKLRDKLRNHYQHITKTRLVPKLMQKFGRSLEAEAEKIDRVTEAVKQLKNADPIDLETQQGSLKQLINQRKEQAKILDRHLKDLQKLKRI